MQLKRYFFVLGVGVDAVHGFFNHGASVRAFAPLQAEATFGMGCFWKPSEELLKVEGVVDTVCGYTGKAVEAGAPPPTYDDVCFGRSWVEAVRVEYDESKLTYEQLLDAFFEVQVPKVGSRQYESIIFPRDENQDLVARKWLSQPRVRDSDGLSKAFTQIEARTPFFRAEQYHQRYWQKMRPRIAVVVGLLTISAGVLDGATPIEWQSTVHTGANAIALLGMLWVLLERKIDTKTVEL